MKRTAALLLGWTLVTSCGPMERLRGGDAGDPASSVTIVRDELGVPHITGATDAAVMFGVGWVQAEDNYWQIEEDYIHALGRAAHWYGPDYLAADMVKAAFEVERLSREEYEREPPERRALWDAYVAGINHWVRTSGTQPRLIAPFEPWMPFALFRGVGAGTVVDGVRLGSVTALQDGTAQADTAPALVGAWDESAAVPVAPTGSNMWAIAPSRSATGHALLFQNPHVGFFGGGQRYEMRIRSASGWHVRGFAILGTPVIRSGHNERVAWSHTNSAADRADAYEVTFDHPTDPLSYRHGGEWRRAAEWRDTLWMNTTEGVVAREVTFRRTHHGPVVAERDGRALAVRLARMEEGGSLQQWLALGRARNLDEFRAALDQRSFPISNTMYADVEGNIYYLHGNAVPVRDTAFDWTRPVDGSDPRTDWRGYHSIGDLPQLLNPASGWIQNTNSTPFLATAPGHNLDASRFPSYMAREGDNARARSSRRLLAADSAWTLDALQQAAFDTWLPDAEDEIAALAFEWEQVGGRNPQRAQLLDEAIDTLRSWDHRATLESTATTLFILQQERLRGNSITGELRRFRALEDVVAMLQRDWQRALVPWGEINRLQRVHTSGRRQAFSDERESLPVPGTPSWSGGIFAFAASSPPGTVRRYGTAGHTWVSVVELAPQVQSRSVVTFGQSADSTSAHFFDQAPLYVRGEMKPAHFTEQDVAAAARRSYRPPPLPRR